MIDPTKPLSEIRWAMAGAPYNTFTISVELFLFLAAQASTEAEFRAALYNEGHVEHQNRHTKAMVAEA